MVHCSFLKVTVHFIILLFLPTVRWPLSIDLFIIYSVPVGWDLFQVKFELISVSDSLSSTSSYHHQFTSIFPCLQGSDCWPSILFHICLSFLSFPFHKFLHYLLNTFKPCHPNSTILLLPSYLYHPNSTILLLPF